MKAKYKLGLILLAGTLAACKDDLGVGPGRQEGYLYFNVSEGHGWAEDGKVTRNGVEAPIPMECSIGGPQLYLHTEVTPTMSPQLEESLDSIDMSGNPDASPQTRGIRYTGDVFTLSTTPDPSPPKITNFGVYATTDQADPRPVIFNNKKIEATSTNSVHGHTQTTDDWDYSWYVKEDEEISGVWDGGKAKFYGYAPYADKDGNPVISSTYGLEITANASTGVPTLTYTAPTTVANQLDILTAKDTGTDGTGVNKGDDVELEFNHVTSALKFRFAYGMKTTDGGTTWTTRNDFLWSNGTYESNGITLKTYAITVSSIQIQGVYKKGSWTVGNDPYTSGQDTWDVDTEAGTANYTYTANKKLTDQSVTTGYINNAVNTQEAVDLNPDADGYVFMMVPQTIPAGAKLVMTCSLVNTSNESDTKTMTLTVSLAGKTWAPGYTYYYTISLSDFVYVFDYNKTITKTYPDNSVPSNPNFHYVDETNNYEWEGFYEDNIFIRSYKLDSKGTKVKVDWEQWHQVFESTAVGAGDDNVETWKKGSNGWIHIYDRNSVSADPSDYNTTEIADTHVGAYDEDEDDDKLFKIAVGSIMTPIIDLSLWNHDQTQRWKGKTGALSGRSTSNCYIVAGPGTYRIPLIYGNAWTNGVKNELAYKTTKTAEQQGTYMLTSNFLNYNNAPISSPFINKDVAVDHAVLIWEEGVDENGSVTTSLRESYGGDGRSSAGSDRGDKYKYDYNVGTVVKVQYAIDTRTTGEDWYNTNNGDYEAGANYLLFEIDPANFNYGNAVVGVCNSSGTILWSWHIWITDPSTFTTGYPMNVDNHDVTFAGTNIGWVDKANAKKTAQSRTGHVKLIQKESGKEIYINATQKKSVDYQPYFTNVLYQWGRKDPIRGIVDFADDDKDYGAPRGSAGYYKYTNQYTNTARIGTLIQEPNSIYGVSTGDLYPFAYSYCNLWGTNISDSYQSTWGTWKFEGKTIYDPSPVGYCVPPSRYLMTLARSSVLIRSTNWARGFDEYDPRDASFPIKCHYSLNDSYLNVGEMYFCTNGLRSTTAGDGLMARGYERSPAALGFYHTSTPYSRDENYQFHIYMYASTDTHTKILGDMCEALSVLPVEWSGETIGTDVDPETQYLTFTFPSGGTLLWKKDDAGTTDRTIEYSLNGTDWVPVTPAVLDINATEITVSQAGGKVYVRGNNSTYCTKSANNYHYCYFKANAAYELSGNIMSLIYGSAYQGKTDFPSGTYNLCYIFYTGRQVGAVDNRNANLEDVSDLVLPATTLTQGCYESMFQDCYNITSAPALPATTGAATDCYKNMFNGCSSLKSVKVMLNPSGSNTYTDDWLEGVPHSGTFFCKSGSTWLSGQDGIPSGGSGGSAWSWDRVDLSE